MCIFLRVLLFFLLTTAVIKNHNLQATAPATTSLIPASETGMRILAQASFATGVRVMGEIGRVLDGTGEIRDLKEILNDRPNNVWLG